MPSFDYAAFLTQAAADARYQALGSLGSSTPSSIDLGDTGSAGVSTSASRQDHQHALNLGGVHVCTSATRPSSPATGTVILETDTGRLLRYTGTAWTQYRLGVEPDQFFTIALGNGTATSFTDFVTQNSILSLPYNYTMVVDARLNSGSNGAGNTVTVRVEDETGASINVGKTVIDTDWILSNSAATQNHAWVALGKKDYAANATCGFRLAYKVSASNIFMDGVVRVSFQAR